MINGGAGVSLTRSVLSGGDDGGDYVLSWGRWLKSSVLDLGNPFYVVPQKDFMRPYNTSSLTMQQNMDERRLEELLHIICTENSRQIIKYQIPA